MDANSHLSDPELVEQGGTARCLVVPDPRGRQVDVARIDERHPRSLIGDVAVEGRGDPRRAGGIGRFLFREARNERRARERAKRRLPPT